MPNISWKPEYMLNHPVVDREHKKLFEIAAEAFRPVAPELRKKKIRDTIINLNEYMTMHFEHEESFMRIIEYPLIHEHQMIHQIIIQNMKTMLNSLAGISIKEFEKDLAFFIESSLVNHILFEDKKIHKWFETKEGPRHVIKWSPKYLTGQKDIDEEHQFLFTIANEAFSTADTPNKKQKLKETVAKLHHYLRLNFEHEESFMQEIAYPDFQTHRQKHEKTLAEMDTFISKLPSMDAATAELELAIFIEKWLILHIIYEDIKIQKFVDSAASVDFINLEEL
ncbi:bacteriohemerythrin [bacterium]|nr:bacteriohemerythrin [bacterium]MBU1989323.1 bacteriohemerythrin [bacterium]